MRGPAEIIQGPFLIGTFFNIFLSGILVVRTYVYFKKYPLDQKWKKAFVLVLVAIDLFNTVINCVYVYQTLVLHFGDVPRLAAAPHATVAEPIVSTVAIELMVQAFYARRIHTLTRSWVIVGLIVALSLAGAAGALVTVIRFITDPQAREFANMQADLKDVIILWLVGAAAADVLISLVLVWFLRKHKNGSKETDILVDRIIRLTMQTNCVTAVIAIVDTIVYLTVPDGTHYVFNLNLCHLYSNSLMSSLNSRNVTTSLHGHRELSTLRFEPGGSASLQTGLQSTLNYSLSDSLKKAGDFSYQHPPSRVKNIVVGTEFHQDKGGMVPGKEIAPGEEV